jgi:hypothetical protein
MSTFARIFLFLVLATMSLPGVAQDLGGFGKFQKEPINAPGSYAVVTDPTGSSPVKKVHSFRVFPGECSDKKYSNGNSDCSFKSVRSQAYETNKKQPTDAWYSWYQYLPGDFPLGSAQKAGGTYSFAYWHNGECPNIDIGVAENSANLFMQTNVFGGPGNCTPDQRINLGSMAGLRGSWHRFEVHVKWSAGADGIVETYIDGNKVGKLAGRNITKGAPQKNYFKFGIYLHGTRGTEKIVPATAFFTGLARAGSRDALPE